MRWAGWVGILFVGLLTSAQAQQLLQRRYDRAHGLPSDYVFDLFQSRAGFIWIATDRGIVRYDGQSYWNITADHGLSSNLVYSFAEDTSSNLWMGTFEGGVCRLDEAGKLTVFGPSQGQANRTAGSVATDATGRVYSLGDKGITCYWQGRWRLWALEAPVPLRQGFGLYELRDGRVAAVLWGNLWLLEPSEDARGFSPRRLLIPLESRGNGIADSVSVLSLWNDHRPGLSNNTLVAHTNRGLLDLRLDDGPAESTAPSPLKLVSRLAQGVPLGVIGHSGWRASATRHDGLTIETGERTLRYTEAQGLPVNSVTTLLLDREGNLWVGTFGGGVVRALSPRSLWLTRREGLPDDFVSAVSVDPKGNIWVGTEKGLAVFDSTGRKLFADIPTGPRPEDRHIRAFAHGPDGTHYAATFTTLYVYRKLGASRQLLYSNKASGGFSALAWGPDGRLWASTYGTALFCYDPARPELGIRPAPVAPTSQMIEYLARGRNNSLWMLTGSSGIDWTDGVTLQHLGRAEGLPSERATCVFEDSSGVQWFGTEQGLARRDWRGWRKYPFGPTLEGRMIHTVFEARTGQSRSRELFLVTDLALHRYNSSLDAFEAVHSYALRPDGETSLNRVCYDPRGERLVLATTRGVVVRELSRLVRNAPAPAPALLAVAVDSLTVTDELLTSPDSTLDVSSGARSLRITLAGLSFSNEDRVKYRTWLRGFELNWSPLTHERTLTYRNLPDGTYSLAVQVINPDGRVTEASRLLTLRVAPPLHKRWYVLLPLSLLAVALFVWAGRALAHQRLMQRIRRLETEQRVQAERERISRDLHDHVGAQLTSILSGLELTERYSSERNPRLGELLHHLRGDAKATIAQLRETIWAINNQSISLGGFLQRVETYFETLTLGRSEPRLSIAADAPLDYVLSPTEALQLYRIVQEAMHNVIKHAQAHQVTLRMIRYQGRLVVSVSDDGVGMPAHSGNGHAPQAESYGLINMHRRAQEIGGELHLRPAEPSGTCVEVSLPYR